VPNQTEVLPARPGVREADRRSTVGVAEQAVRGQVLFRAVNERIAELTDLGAGLGVNLFICECGNDVCAESLEIRAAEYEAVREHGERFVVLAGHESSELEHVVDGNDRFLVVQKDGAAAELAIAGDPRRS
jgi:hypothetical protein